MIRYFQRRAHRRALAQRIFELTTADFVIIARALEDRARFYAGEPAGEAAMVVRRKIGAIR